MHSRPQVTRFKLALVAVAFAFGALYIQYTGLLPAESKYVVSTVYETGLLPKVVSFAELKVQVQSPRFVGALPCQVDVAEVPEHPSQFRMLATHPKAQVAEEALKRAEKLLALELKGMATSEVESTLRYLDELREAEELRRENRSRRLRELESRSPQDSLSLSESGRVLELKKEIRALQEFESSGKFPKWLQRRITGSDLKMLEREIRISELELQKLTKLWSAKSEHVATQRKVLKSLKKERRELRLRLAASLRKANEEELKSLSEKHLNLVKERERRSQATSDEGEASPERSEEGEAFFQEQSQKLAEKAKRRSAMARLKTVSGPSISETRASGYWATFVCWTLALLSLLGSLFVSAGRRGRWSAPEKEAVSVETSVARSPISSPAPPPEPVAESQAQLQAIYEKIGKTLGRAPARILVLGNEEGTARSSFSLRLAKSFGSHNHRVKLVDFDLPEKELTARLGDRATPGVGDILSAGGGPVEEFFASLPGTNIEFAAAGSHRVLHEPICSETLDALLKQPTSGLTLVDASFNSPLHLLVGHVDAVLCITRPGRDWSEQEEQVLLALRDAKLPLWGVARGGSQIFPFI